MTTAKFYALSSSSTTTTTTTPANSNTFFNKLSNTSKTMVLDSIKRDYQSAIGKSMPPFVEQEILSGLASGTPVRYYQYALKETSIAPLPSWRYAAAILKRLAVQGLEE